MIGTCGLYLGWGTAAVATAAAGLALWKVRKRPCSEADIFLDGRPSKRSRGSTALREAGAEASEFIGAEDLSSVPAILQKPFPLLELVGQPVLLTVCQHLAARDIACLKSTCRELSCRLDGEEVSQWVVKSRDWARLEQVHRAGDLPLNIPEEGWTLERLHLAENPPRFQKLQFDFASNELPSDGPNGSVACLEYVARLLVRHQGIRIRVTGYTQPDAPRFVAKKISAGRARSVAMYLVLRLSGVAVTRLNLAMALRALHEEGIAVVQAGTAAAATEQSFFNNLSFSSDSPVSDGADGEDESDSDSKENSPLMRIDAPPQWQPGAAVKHLPELSTLDPEHLSTHLLKRSRLANALRPALARIQAVGRGGSAPINANWEEEPMADLAMDRRVEFTLRSI
mmetsp:Transcript_13179/g.37116  ORF Transcript_13179/g.37116 Transcript_13179/m.37116 type:complete len:398 (+) Transcript_13179:101-1294(+)